MNEMFIYYLHQTIQKDISSLYATVSEEYKKEWDLECQKHTYTECPDVVKQVYVEP